MTASGRTVTADLLLSAGALMLLLAWEASGWDLRLIRVYGQADGFAWRDHWLTRALLHDGGRWLAGTCLAALAWDALRPVGAGPSRGERRYWLAIVLASLVSVPLLKRFTSTSCPWDLAEFGGRAAYVPHWMLGVADGGPGHCFPAGHAVSAFAFFGVYFLWRPYRPAFARVVLGAVMLLGIAFGWAQMARGAHFASHNLWTAWLCWILAVAAQRHLHGAAAVIDGSIERGARRDGHQWSKRT
jgi:membrane-associated PAP2 superfamily phosphatase